MKILLELKVEEETSVIVEDICEDESIPKNAVIPLHKQSVRPLTAAASSLAACLAGPVAAASSLCQSMCEQAVLEIHRHQTDRWSRMLHDTQREAESEYLMQQMGAWETRMTQEFDPDYVLDNDEYRAATEPEKHLTKLQMDVVQLLAECVSIDDIDVRLGVSAETLTQWLEDPIFVHYLRWQEDLERFGRMSLCEEG